MASPIIIQGTAVPNPATQQQQQQYQTSSPYGNNGNNYGYNDGTTNTSTFNREEKQESGCKDPIFVVLFYGCVFAIAAVAALYGPDAFAATTTDNSSSSGTTQDIDYSGAMTLAAILVFLSFIGAAVGMGLMMMCPQFLIKTSLIFVTVLAGVLAVYSFLYGNILGGIMGAIFFAFSLCYAYAVWSRIPFATVNLITACTAVRKHLTVVMLSYFFAILAAGWTILWSVAFFGIYDKTYKPVCDANGVCTATANYGILFGMFIALFFGQQVIQNSIHVCIAGTVGTWWFTPKDESVGCCDTNVYNSFIRTVTTSFGSICFGSLLVAIIQALRELANQARQNGDAAIFACIAECILGCLASLLEYFNKWAFIYVGLYGMSYMKAGKSVFELFASRGWEAVIADDLIGNTLFLVSLLVGALIGGIGAGVAAGSNLIDSLGNGSVWIAFALGFVIGLVITSILLSTIGSAVNAVIVLFAEAPNDFQSNHPELSQKMREVWNEVYPGSVS